MKIRNILAGIDFERHTEHVLAYASLFAENFQASVHLLHVIDYLVTPPVYLDQYIEEEKRVAEKRFETMKQELSASGIKVNAGVTVGRLQVSFEAAVKKTDADMLILGFASHALRRSSSEKLIKGLQMPMLVVRGEKAEAAYRGKVQITKILCPTDFSEMSKKALHISRELARVFSSGIDVMHVLPESVMKKMEALENKDRAMKDVYEQEKSRFAEFLSASSLETTGIMDQGEPHKKIVTLAKEKDIDLIVMGARGLGLIKGMLIGSVTDAVLKSSPCPVLVAH
jgi:nucleotide-binding universal stress UspA family protein